jgi:hypothetical protein
MVVAVAVVMAAASEAKTKADTTTVVGWIIGPVPVGVIWIRRSIHCIRDRRLLDHLASS